MSEKIFWIQKIQKTQFSFLTTYPFELRKKLLNHSFELVCNQAESYLHRYIQSVLYKWEMSEKIFWIQKIQKTQFSFLTTYPFELRKKLLNHPSELAFDQTKSHFYWYIISALYKVEMSEKIFWIQKNQKAQFSFLTTYPFQLRNKPLNYSPELVCNQTESHFHRFIQSVSYKWEMSEKIFWNQKIQKTQANFLTTYSFELPNKSLNKPLQQVIVIRFDGFTCIWK